MSETEAMQAIEKQEAVKDVKEEKNVSSVAEEHKEDPNNKPEDLLKKMPDRRESIKDMKFLTLMKQKETAELRCKGTKNI